MNKKLLLMLWAGLFSLCAGLGFIPEPEGSLQLVMTAASVIFFLPPALLLYISLKQQDTDTVKLVRNLSALSLGLTSILLILNFLTVLRSEFLGQVLHNILVIVSAPMICSSRWAVSLFFWSCLLVTSWKQTKR